jgi:aquaporin Z
MFARDAASQALGMALEEVRPGYARLRMTVRADMLNGHGTCHGGLVFALADSAFAFACNSHDLVTVASGCSIEFLAPAHEGRRADRRGLGARPRGPERHLRRERPPGRRRADRRVPGPVGVDARARPRLSRGVRSLRQDRGAHGDFRRRPTSPEVRMDSPQKFAAELLGTFVLVFGGTTAVVASGLSGSPVLIVASLAFGLALLAGLYAFGEVSGGHYNPAVSLAMFVAGRLPSGDLVSYWIAQFAGGILAAIMLWIATDRDAVGETVTVPGVWGNGTAFLMELLFTAIFVLVILRASESELFGRTALLAIPLALVVVQLAAIPFSGASVNPARTFGPDLIAWDWDGIWIYLIATPLGALIAVAVYRFVHGGVTAPPPAPTAEPLGESQGPR